MRNLQRYGNECIAELADMGIDISGLPVIIWSVNNRAKSRFGQCHNIQSEGRSEINIAKFLLDENITPDDIGLKNTIIHELLHALAPGEGHRGKWKKLADSVTRKSNGKYVIKRCSSYEEKGVDRDGLQITSRKRSKAKYVIRCEHCGMTATRTRMTKVIRRPDLYRCGRCSGSLVVDSVN